MRPSHLFLILLSAALAVEPSQAADPPPIDSCSCLQRAEPDTNGRRDGGPGFSIIVPGDAYKDHDSLIGEYWSSQWGDHAADGKSRFTYYMSAAYGPGGEKLFVTEGARRCSFMSKGRRIDVVDYIDDDGLNGRFTLQALIPGGEGQPKLRLEGGAKDKASVCRMMGSAIDSASFFVDWTHWQLKHVSDDHKSFEFTDEFGEPRTAKFGDYLTMNRGRVTYIADRKVAFTELIAGPNGEWSEQVRVLSLDRSPYTQSAADLSRDLVDAAPSSRDYCTCLAAPFPYTDLRYDGGLAASFLIPSRAQRLTGVADVEHAGVERATWRFGASEIRYVAGVTDVSKDEESARYEFDHLGREECAVDIGHGRVSIKAIAEDGRQGLHAEFEKWPLPWYGFRLEVLADRDSMCSWGAALIRSVDSDANDWRYLAVVSVSPDQTSFVYRNRVGIERRGYVGSRVSKDLGQVSRISNSSVRVSGLEPDADGRLEEVERSMPFEGAAGLE